MTDDLTRALCALEPKPEIDALGRAHDVDVTFGVYGAPCGYKLRRIGLWDKYPHDKIGRVELTYMPDEESEVFAFIAWRITQPNSPPPKLNLAHPRSTDPVSPTFDYAWTWRALETYRRGIAKRDAARSRRVDRVTDSLGHSAIQERGTIYFFRVAGTEEVKVGYTRGNPLSRMGALQTGNPYQLVCVGLMFGTMEDEKRIHRMLAPRRTRGEFFRLSDSDVNELLVREGSK